MHQARFITDNGFTSPDEAWIVKESRYEKTLEEEDLFHRKSLITQKWAEILRCNPMCPACNPRCPACNPRCPACNPI